MGMAPENPRAFPAFENVEKYDEDRGKYVEHMLPTEGMTLRDYFAAKAMASMIETYAVINGGGIGTDHMRNNVPVLAYKMADAMLAERSK